MLKIKTEFVDEDLELETRLERMRQQKRFLRSLGITKENIEDFHIEITRDGPTETIRVFPKNPR